MCRVVLAYPCEGFAFHVSQNNAAINPNKQTQQIGPEKIGKRGVAITYTISITLSGPKDSLSSGICHPASATQPLEKADIRSSQVWLYGGSKVEGLVKCF